jgi:hypothetical protein
MAAEGETLVLEPAELVPPELIDDIRLHKSELINKVPPRHPLDSELSAIVYQVSAKGYACLWSTVLEDNIAFVGDILEDDLRPVGFVIYTLDELSKLFGDSSLSADSLRMIHTAKKYGGKITDVRPS